MFANVGKKHSIELSNVAYIYFQHLLCDVSVTNISCLQRKTMEWNYKITKNTSKRSKGHKKDVRDLTNKIENVSTATGLIQSLLELWLTRLR